MIFSVGEAIDVVVMTVAVGYIFKDLFPRQRAHHDPLLELAPAFAWKDLLFAVAITAPATIFHELAHKLVALALGVPATFHAAYWFLALAIILKMFHFPFIFFVPGYVSHAAAGTIQSVFIASAGPALNLLLWLGAAGALRVPAIMRQIGRRADVLIFTAKINMFLFIFNMLPIPPFDGFTVFSGLFEIVRRLF